MKAKVDFIRTYPDWGVIEVYLEWNSYTPKYRVKVKNLENMMFGC